MSFDYLAQDIDRIDLLALAQADVPLRRASRGRRGEEWVGPCPVCHAGRDRFHVWPAPPDRRPNYWCRVCEATGDAISYLRWTGRAASFADALAYLGLRGSSPGASAHRPAPRAPLSCDPPPEVWQQQARALVFAARSQLWTDQAAVPRRWLHSRGLSARTLAHAHLGWQPAPHELPRAAWGLEPSDDGRSSLVIPAGIVIPTIIDGLVWRLEIRRIEPNLPPKRKYRTVPGSANALYNAGALRPGYPAILVEGAFDALAVAQEAGDLATPVACGTAGARRVPWMVRLACCRPVLVALDADPDPQKGDSASAWWLDVLKLKAIRWRPLLKDPAAMLEKGISLHSWLHAGLEAAASLGEPAAQRNGPSSPR